MMGTCEYCLPRHPVQVEPGFDLSTGRHVYCCSALACRVRCVLVDVQAQWPRWYSHPSVFGEKVTRMRKLFGQVA